MLNPDYRDILGEFASAGVEFLVVGAFAMAAHGLPRATGDIDLWVRCGDANARRVMVALARFGAPLENVSAADFLVPGLVVQFGVAPCRVDLLTKIDGVGFEEAWRDRVTVEMDGVAVPVIGREHLLLNKRAAGRPKDQVDAATLAKVKGRR